MDPDMGASLVLRVRHPEVPEDLVQETLFAAVRTYANLRGTSSERSWLCGILKNKICDYFRRLAHEVSFTDLESSKTRCLTYSLTKVGITILALPNGSPIRRRHWIAKSSGRRFAVAWRFIEGTFKAG
jgi:hypothetical protein